MIKRNIAANVLGRVWGIVSVYLFIPLYLEYLGVDAYGLVGFYSILMAVLVFADVGLTATITREMARLSVEQNPGPEMRDTLRTYETSYVLISTLLSGVLWILAPTIAGHWLRSRVLQSNEMVHALRLMGVAIALQFPAGLYIGGLIGLQQQVLTNSLQAVWGLVRGLGAVFVLRFFSPTIGAFAGWQLISNLLYLVGARQALWIALPRSTWRPRFRWLVITNTWRYAAGMAGMAIITPILTQTDKLIVSKMLALTMLGYYTLAGTLGSVAPILANPIVSAVFPRLTGLAATGDRLALTNLYHRTCLIISVAVLPASLMLALFASDFIFGWTGNAVAAREAGLPASLLVAGAVFQGLQVTPYYLMLAHGYTRLNLLLGVASVVLMVPLMMLAIPRWGLVGAGVSWLIMNICTMPPYMYFIHRRFLPGELRRWYLRDVGLPLATALPWIALGRWLMPHTSSRLVTLSYIGLVWIIASVGAAACVPEVRDSLVGWRRLRVGVSP